jgi:hypothetical protein
MLSAFSGMSQRLPAPLLALFGIWGLMGMGQKWSMNQPTNVAIFGLKPSVIEGVNHFGP